jgi:crotonobetainyl-CoA:carnitine CoA-transferase CaiB-like acyl-CoA transferase
VSVNIYGGEKLVNNPAPLDGVTVVDFTQVMLGPSATQVLADFGARVIKVERIGSGDLSRSTLPDDPGGLDNPVFQSLNRNKRSICIDPRRPEGAELAHRLIRTADVVVSNFRPDVMDRLGLGWDTVHQINPRAIYALGTGYGVRGPYVHKGGQDMLAQALSGVLARRADPSRPPEIFATTLGDYTAGMHLAQAILLALLARERTGEGQCVEVSLYDSMIAMQMQEATNLLMRDTELNWAAMPHTGSFETTDGAVVVVGAFRDEPIKDLCEALEIDDLTAEPRFATFTAQSMNRSDLHDQLRKAFASNSTDYWMQRLEARDFLCAPVRNLGDALADSQTAINGMLLQIGTVRTVASPLHLSATPAIFRLAPPQLGEHTDEILSELGVSDQEIADLRTSGAIA